MTPILKPALACLLLTACAAVIPSSAARLAMLDPLTADPAAIEVAVILPPGLAITPGSTRLELGTMRGTERLLGSFALQDRPTVPGLTAPNGSVARVLALTPADAGIAGQNRAMGQRGASGGQPRPWPRRLCHGRRACAGCHRFGADPPWYRHAVSAADPRRSPVRPAVGPQVLAAIQPCKGPA